MITKIKLQEQMSLLPDKFSIDELVERLIFIEKVEKGLEQYEEGKVLTEQELETEMKKWFE